MNKLQVTYKIYKIKINEETLLICFMNNDKKNIT